MQQKCLKFFPTEVLLAGRPSEVKDMSAVSEIQKNADYEKNLLTELIKNT